eukprot:2109165-Rhodomonas_salina.1
MPCQYHEAMPVPKSVLDSARNTSPDIPIPYFSTAHCIVSYATSVPHGVYHHTLHQYRTVHNTICHYQYHEAMP